MLLSHMRTFIPESKPQNAPVHTPLSDNFILANNSSPATMPEAFLFAYAGNSKQNTPEHEIMDKKINSEGICGRVRQLRIEHAGLRGKASFARQLDLSPSTYDYYENDRVPPAEVIARIADLTGADLQWLLTGVEGGASSPSSHPAVTRAARLMESQPGCAEALSAFVHLLEQMHETFPSSSAQADSTTGKATSEPTSPDRPVPGPGTACIEMCPSRSKAEDLIAAVASVPPVAGLHTAAHAALEERQGWIPILGRSAAGVPHFWRDTDFEPTGATHLADLVATMKPRDARHVSRALAEGDLGADSEHVQLVLLDSPEPPGTAEFVIAEHIARRYRVLFGVRIDGESMEPEISHGDVVIVSPELPAVDGQSAVVQLSDQIGVTCKLYRRDDGDVHLIPINETFSPTVVSADEVVWALKVIARVRPV